jgi:hypothetical protein
MEALGARLELARFLQIFRDNPCPLEMWSSAVDNEWHQLLKDGDEYNMFCMQQVGKYVGHSEGQGFSGISSISWIQEYEKKFGELGLIWFHDQVGQIDLNLCEEYLWTGEVYASWNCHPAPPEPMDDPIQPGQSGEQGPLVNEQGPLVNPPEPPQIDIGDQVVHVDIGDVARQNIRDN